MASKARLEGICDYRLWTTEELIEAYAWEAKKTNQKDRETASTPDPEGTEEAL